MVSSLVADPKTAANIVPLILIPQISWAARSSSIEDMNRNLGFVYSMTRWFTEHPTDEQRKKMDSKLQVPFVCQFIAMRWSYEELVVAQAKLNPLTRRQERTQREIEAIVAGKQTPESVKRLYDLEGNAGGPFRAGSEIAAGAGSLSSTDRRHLAGKNRFDRGVFKEARPARSRRSSFI